MKIKNILFLITSFSLFVGFSVNVYGFSYGNSTYQIIEGSYTWDEAKLDAVSRGGHLVTLTSQAEDNAVRNSGLYLNFRNNGGNLVWLGAESFSADGIFRAEWYWVTGEEISYETYDNWYVGLTTSAYYGGNAGWSSYFIHGSGGVEWYPINKDSEFEGSYMLETPATVPEPSSYALICGGLAIGFVVFRRR